MGPFYGFINPQTAPPRVCVSCSAAAARTSPWGRRTPRGGLRSPGRRSLSSPGVPRHTGHESQSMLSWGGARPRGQAQSRGRRARPVSGALLSDGLCSSERAGLCSHVRQLLGRLWSGGHWPANQQCRPLSTSAQLGRAEPGPCPSLCSYLSAARTGSSTPALTGPQPADAST